jgi:phosphatidate cytidylyltransferase
VTQTTPNPAAFGKAGRNLKAATTVGVSLILALLASLFVIPQLYPALVAVAMIFAVNELMNAAVKGASQRLIYTAQFSAIAIVVAAATNDLTTLIATLVGAVFVVMAIRLLDGQEAYVHHITRTIFVLLYAPMLAAFSVLLWAQEDGAWRVLAFVLLTAGADLGGYFAGIFFGKHRMAPKISPKKTWEGLAGALLVQVIVGAFLFPAAFDLKVSQGIGIAIVMTFTAVAGDLIESMIKRDLGIKDMGSMLPGHGGVMDRLDALLINAFVAWVFFTIIFAA